MFAKTPKFSPIKHAWNGKPEQIIQHMTEFNHAIWNSWILEGYTVIRYARLDENTALLTPFKELPPAGPDDTAYVVNIVDEDVRDWADNNIPLLENFRFVVDEETE